MNAGMKIGLGVVGGYVLGRRKKAKLALGLGAYLLGKKLDMSPRELAIAGLNGLQGIPEIAELKDSVRGELVSSGRQAATAALSNQLNSVADSLSQRTANMNGGGAGEQDDDSDDRDQRDESAEYDEYDDEDTEDTEPRGRGQRDESDGDDEYDDEDGEYDDEGTEDTEPRGRGQRDESAEYDDEPGSSSRSNRRREPARA